MTRFHDPTRAHAAGRPPALRHDSGDPAERRGCAPSATATTEALTQALRARARSAASALARGASARALAMSQWSTRAPRRARLLDTVIGSARHRLADDWPERTCANIWVRRVAADVLPGRSDPARAALERIVGTCIPVARALARARLALHMHPTGRAAVLERLDRLCAALGEDRTAWHLPVARLPVLEALPEAGWRGLERAPAWAVVRALGETAAPGPDDLRDLETLAQDLGRWAAPRVGAAARTERIRLDGAPDPGRVAALLARWRWPAAEPPLAMVAAYADTGRTDLTDDAWAAALTLAPCGDVPLWITAEQHALAVEHQAAALRARIDAGIENEALGLLARWLLELDGDPPGGPGLADANDRAYRALEQMRTLWAAEPRLAPRGPDAAALRLGPETPSAHRPAELSRLDDAVRPRRLLVWRVPCTDPAPRHRGQLWPVGPASCARQARIVRALHPQPRHPGGAAPDARPCVPEADRARRGGRAHRRARRRVLGSVRRLEQRSMSSAPKTASAPTHRNIPARTRAGHTGMTQRERQGRGGRGKRGRSRR